MTAVSRSTLGGVVRRRVIAEIVFGIALAIVGAALGAIVISPTAAYILFAAGILATAVSAVFLYRQQPEPEPEHLFDVDVIHGNARFRNVPSDRRILRSGSVGRLDVEDVRGPEARGDDEGA
jgi:hypothetical protein